VTPRALAAAAQSRALIFGSLVGRSPHNLEQLEQLLGVQGPTKLFDVNLRPPFVDPKLILNLAKRADVLKLNDDELGTLTAWVTHGSASADAPPTELALTAACNRLAEASGVSRICVTRGSKGAVFWERGSLCSIPAPPTSVRDTVGAGDAFMAGLTYGLVRARAPQQTLDKACQLGAFVASQHGATPCLPETLREAVQRG
jgi:fructokinase